jgi:hypothetical protein
VTSNPPRRRIRSPATSANALTAVRPGSLLLQTLRAPCGCRPVTRRVPAQHAELDRPSRWNRQARPDINGRRGCPWSFPWSFRHTSHGRTGPYQLDGASDLTSEDDTLRDGMDGCGSTSNPYGAGSSPARGTRLPGQRPAVLVVEMLPSAGQSFGIDRGNDRLAGTGPPDTIVLANERRQCPPELIAPTCSACAGRRDYCLAMTT